MSACDWVSVRVFDFCVGDSERFDPNIEAHDDDDYVEETGQVSSPRRAFTLELFGLNEAGETFWIHTQSFQPFFYIKVGAHWTQSQVDAEFPSFLVRKLGGREHAWKYKLAVASLQIADFTKLYGYSGGETNRFLRITFCTQWGFSLIKGLWFHRAHKRFEPLLYPDGTPLELYESNLPPLLRFFHIHGISPSGWVQLPAAAVSRNHSPRTTCTHECFVESCADLRPQPDKETAVPYKICSFDIEASSSHGDFPLAVKTYKRLAAALVAQHDQGHPARSILSTGILDAFGFSSSSSADPLNKENRVYPREQPTREAVLQFVRDILATPLAELTAAAPPPAVAATNSLARMFARSASRNAVLSGSGAGGDSDSGGEEDGGGGGGRGGWTAAAKRKIEDPAVLAAEYLLSAASAHLTRDTRVNLLDDLLTRKLPPLLGDQVTFIGTTFLRHGQAAPYRQTCIVKESGGAQCGAVERVEVQTVASERDLLLAWTQLMRSEDPDIVIGYNIFGFDYEFMFHRAKACGCLPAFLQLSRRRDEVCTPCPWRFAKSADVDDLELEHTPIVLASGEYHLKYVKMPGRVQIDLYTYFRRDFNLASYKLDDVAGLYLSDDALRALRDPRDHGRLGLATRNTAGLSAGDWVRVEVSSFTSDFAEEGRKFPVLAVAAGGADGGAVVWLGVGADAAVAARLAELVDTQAQTGRKVKWCVAKDDVSPQDIFRLSASGRADDLAVVAKYCVQDCNLVHHLFAKVDVLTGYHEMARICSVPMSFLVFRGQGIKLTSYVAKKCRERGVLMPDLMRPASAEEDIREGGVTEDAGYEGAIVLVPKCAMYIDDPVACVDYASLYPSVIISGEYSHNSKLWAKEFDLAGAEVSPPLSADQQRYVAQVAQRGLACVEVEFDLFRMERPRPGAKAERRKVGVRRVCWVQLGEDAILPSILRELLRARADTRRQIKAEKDPFMQNILDKRQAGYKVTANSLYGQCGARTSAFYEKDIAASTTATGRQMILYAKRVIEQAYGNGVLVPVGDKKEEEEAQEYVQCFAEYVYGDTDSVFFRFGLREAAGAGAGAGAGAAIKGQRALELTIELAQRVARQCSDWLKAPMELTYEKTLMPFILLAKKRYVGMLFETNARRGKLKFMGLSLKRKDSCDYQKDVYGKVLLILMQEHDVAKALEVLRAALETLLAGQVPMAKLCITKALRGYYKMPQQIAHAVLAERIGARDPGNKPKPGDRIRFVHIVPPATRGGPASAPLLQGHKIETPDFVLQNELKIDYEFYVTNQLMKPFQQLLGLNVEAVLDYCLRRGGPGPGAAATRRLGEEYRRQLAALQREAAGDLELWNKKKEKISADVVKQCLFDDILGRIDVAKQNLQPITRYYNFF